MTIAIIFADADLVIVDKPSGLLSVPGRGTGKADCAAARVALTFPDALTVHRLDMATSGLLMFARSKAMQSLLSKQFAAGQIAKTYIADVAGELAADEGEIDLPLIADWPRRPLQKVCYQTGKPSRTRWQVRERRAGATRLTLTPLTGRSHQLRVHLAAIGHPILGDEFYAPPEIEALAPRLCLHAAALSFTHPHTGMPVDASSDCPF